MIKDYTGAVIRLLAYASALSLLGVSIAMNLQAGIAKSEALSGQITWGAASAASDVLKALSPIFIVWAIAQREVLRALAGTALLIVTAGYAIISAVSYTHGSREDLVGLRGSEAATHERAESSYRAAQAALSELPSTRPSAEVKASLSGLLADPNAGDCQIIDGPVTRRVCPQVAELRAELARADERARLQGELKEAKGRLDGLPAPKVGDPATEAVTRALGQIGFVVDPANVALWLSFSGVVLIEVGSIFGLLLASGSAVPIRRENVTTHVGRDHLNAPREVADNARGGLRTDPVTAVVAPPTTRRSARRDGAACKPEPRPRGRPRLGTASALGKLRKMAIAGTVQASQSELGTMLGVSKTTAHRELQRLQKAGALTLSPGKRSTMICLL